MLKVGDRVEWTGDREPGESCRGHVISIIADNAYVHAGDGEWIGTIYMVDGRILELSSWKVSK